MAFADRLARSGGPGPSTNRQRQGDSLLGIRLGVYFILPRTGNRMLIGYARNPNKSPEKVKKTP